MLIRQDTILRPGVYFLPDGLTIGASGITLDGNGALLVGDHRRGAGIRIDGHCDVTIRNLRIREYTHGIAARQCRRLTIASNQITSTAEISANSIFLDIFTPVEQAYGGGILLERVEESRIHDNDLQHQMCGLLTYFCCKLDVRRNNASYCSGFGFHLFSTCDSTFEENWADYCNRYEPRDPGGPKVGAGAVGHIGADATGFLIVCRSCNNVFRRNAARCGGDGVFLAGMYRYNEPAGCDNNLFEENDCSLSPNNAFEATFGRGNIFRNNWADRSNYGFWLGYSVDNVLEGNRMLLNRQAGIAAEHAVGFQIRDNDFQGNGHGVLLWTQYHKEFYELLPQQRSVRDCLIERNKFYRNGTAIAILAERDHGIRPTSAEAARPELRPRGHVIRDNDIQDNRVGIHLAGADGTVIERNKINRNVEADLRRDDDRDTQLGHNLGLRGAYL